MLIGKSTISMAMFNSILYVYQAGYNRRAGTSREAEDQVQKDDNREGVHEHLIIIPAKMMGKSWEIWDDSTLSELLKLLGPEMPLRMHFGKHTIIAIEHGNS